MKQLEKIIGRISILTFMCLQLFFAFLTTFIASLFFNTFKKDLATIVSSQELLFYVILVILTFTAGNFLILTSISAKNATLAGLIEISYPLFIAIFSYILFKENHINIGTTIGGVMIFLGVFIIYYFNH